MLPGANISAKRSGTDDGGTEGPERGVEARSAGAPRGVWSGEGRRSPSPIWGSGGYAPRNFFQKSTLKSRIFGIFASGNGLFCSGVKAGLDNRKYNMVQ